MKLTPKFQINDDEDLILEFEEHPGQEINLSNLQTDDTSIIRIYQDRSGKTLKIGGGWWLVAEVTLPGIEYQQEPVLDENGDSILDENGEPKTESKRMALTEKDVTVVLWELKQ